MLVKCGAKTCVNYNDGMCKAKAIEIKNFTWYSEEEKEELDEMRCDTYKYYVNWMLKPVSM
ncbi:DUF1540 domain-containing protein [Clostridium saccharoperbutylacetonicum]|uniref:DUF1540 domain-containing protein n=1 Tax=Clostridium saccharoperbutylacetonicum TaxID=36745 RepID=UPI0039E8C2FF